MGVRPGFTDPNRVEQLSSLIQQDRLHVPVRALKVPKQKVTNFGVGYTNGASPWQMGESVHNCSCVWLLSGIEVHKLQRARTKMASVVGIVNQLDIVYSKVGSQRSISKIR